MSRPANTRFAIGVHALTMLAHDPDATMSAEEMAGSIGANPVHVRRVLGRLRTAGLVRSRPGPNGGWRLLRDPSAIRLGDVLRAVDGGDRILGVHESNPDCTIGRGIQSVLLEIDRRAAQAVVDELDTTTVADVIASADVPAVAAAP